MRLKRAPVPEYKYSEISQTSSITFSLGHLITPKTIQEWFYPVRCRDFLSDCVYAHHTQKEFYIYNFTTPTWVDPNPYLLVHGSEEELTNLKSNVPLLSNLFNVEFPYIELNKTCIAFTDVALFYKTPWAISFLTALIRMHGYAANMTDPLHVHAFRTEFTYISKFNKKVLLKLSKNIYNLVNVPRPPGFLIHGYSEPTVATDWAIHNRCGFVSVFTHPDNLYTKALHAL